MKKLTAGIFATILGLTAVDAFAAAAGTPVASTNYVHDVVKTLDSSKDNGTAPIAGVTMTDGKVTAVTPADMSAYALKADVNTSLGDYVTTATYEAGQEAQDTEINAAKTNATTAVNAATAATNVAGEAKTAAEGAQSVANTAKSTADQALADAATAKSDAATAKSDAATAKSDAEKAKTDAESAKSTAEANAADIVTIKAEQTTQNNAIDALEAAAGNYVKWTDVVDSYGSN